MDQGNYEIILVMLLTSISSYKILSFLNFDVVFSYVLYFSCNPFCMHLLNVSLWTNQYAVGTKYYLVSLWLLYRIINVKQKEIRENLFRTKFWDCAKHPNKSWFYILSGYFGIYLKFTFITFSLLISGLYERTVLERFFSNKGELAVNYFHPIEYILPYFDLFYLIMNCTLYIVVVLSSCQFGPWYFAQLKEAFFFLLICVHLWNMVRSNDKKNSFTIASGAISLSSIACLHLEECWYLVVIFNCFQKKGGTLFT